MYNPYKTSVVLLIGCLVACAQGTSDTAMSTTRATIPTTGVEPTAGTGDPGTQTDAGTSSGEGTASSDTGPATTDASDSDDPTEDPASETEDTDATDSDATDSETTGATEGETTEGETTEGETTEGETTEGVCDENDVCCLAEDELPPHALLDSFLAKYGEDAMPKTADEVKDFEPFVDDYYMAWSDENAGNELIDAENGGIIEANIEQGRTLSREAAELSLPDQATILNVREDPIVIVDLGTPEPCHGIGWGWGSLLFEAEDMSIGELVYLYVGYCSDGDVEAFFYSDQAVEICAPS